MTETSVASPTPRPFPETRTSPSDTLVVTARDQVAEDVVLISLARADGGRLPNWTPGAHIDLILPSGATRQYSLCGDRWGAHTYQIAVQKEDDSRGGSAEVHSTMHPGTTAQFGGPRNNFRMGPAEHYRFIAGGIGITPILPMIRQAHLLGADWKLLYLGRERGRLPFQEELPALYGDNVEVHVSGTSGRRNIRAWLDNLPDEALIYACGPEPLLNAAESLRSSFSPPQVRTERFSAKAQTEASSAEPYEVVLEATGRTVQAQAHQTIAEALHSAGIDIVTSCGQGVCGTCETTVLDGQPDHRDSILEADEREDNTCVFPCVSRSTSRRLVMDL